MAAARRVAAAVLGYIFSFALIGSPIRTMVAIKRANAVGNRSVMNYIGTWFNAAAMVAYTLPTQGYPIAGINGLALLAELFYTCFYRRYAQGRARRVATSGIVVEGLWLVFLAALYFAFFFQRNEELRVKIFGGTAAATAIIMYATMFFDTIAVIRTQDVSQHNILLLLSAVGNSSSWMVLAIKPRDLYVLVPNAVGMGLTAIQFVVWMIVWMRNRNNPPPPPQHAQNPQAENQNQQPAHVQNQQGNQQPPPPLNQQNVQLAAVSAEP